MSRPLRAVLLDACPPDENGRKSIAGLAKALGVSRQRLYGRIDHGKISPGYAERIVQVCDGSLTLDDLEPYILRPGKK